MNAKQKQQYEAIRKQYPNVLLLFRNGNNYEAYFDDAVKLADQVPVQYSQGGEVRLAGFQSNKLDAFLPKLVRAGYRIAICDELEA